jgi:hypothetical protein
MRRGRAIPATGELRAAKDVVPPRWYYKVPVAPVWIIVTVVRQRRDLRLYQERLEFLEDRVRRMWRAGAAPAPAVEEAEDAPWVTPFEGPRPAPAAAHAAPPVPAPTPAMPVPATSHAAAAVPAPTPAMPVPAASHTAARVPVVAGGEPST